MASHSLLSLRTWRQSSALPHALVAMAVQSVITVGFVLYVALFVSSGLFVGWPHGAVTTTGAFFGALTGSAIYYGREQRDAENKTRFDNDWRHWWFWNWHPKSQCDFFGPVIGTSLLTVAMWGLAALR